VLVRTAHAFLRERHVKKCPVRFDVVAIDHTPGSRRSCGCTRMPWAREVDIRFSQGGYL